MPSQWYCFTDDESGPYTFQELAEMIARGDLQNADLIRRAESKQWQRVDSVLGLLRAARNFRMQPVSRHGKLGTRLITLVETCLPHWNGERLILIGSVLLILGGLVQIGRLWLDTPTPFPPGPRDVVVLGRLKQLRPPKPATATIPSLAVGKPVLVPGFENVSWMKCPTLSSDLLTIVYVGYSGGSTRDDLMIAHRKHRSDPFEHHRTITGTQSPALETHPALSPDGCTLVFVRQEPDQPSKLWMAERADVHSPFSKAQELRLSDQAEGQQHLDAPQFLNSSTLVVTITDLEFQQRRQWLVKLSRSGKWLHLSAPLPAVHPWLRYFIRADGMRGYAASDEGLLLTGRSRRQHELVAPELLFGTDVTGPGLADHDDTIWVSPAEDLIFFCAPGPDAAQPEDRRLWMIRL